MFGMKKKETVAYPDPRQLYDESIFHGRKLIDSGQFEEWQLLQNLLLQGEVNRRDTKELLTAILETQQEILKELRKQNATSVISRAA